MERKQARQHCSVVDEDRRSVISPSDCNGLRSFDADIEKPLATRPFYADFPVLSSPLLSFFVRRNLCVADQKLSSLYWYAENALSPLFYFYFCFVELECNRNSKGLFEQKMNRDVVFYPAYDSFFPNSSRRKLK